MTAALASLPYPITTREAAERLADWPVLVGPDEARPLGEMLARLPQDRFADPGQALRAVDRHWTQMVEDEA